MHDYGWGRENCVTSEVVLMNRLAVALAADSATTFTYWNKGTSESRFFKGANKIFNLLPGHPVGLMTYANANLQGVPWEVVVKAFRKSKLAKQQKKLEAYANALFQFVEKDKNLFPEKYQVEQFTTLVENLAFRIYIEIIGDDRVSKAPDDNAKKLAAAQLLSEREKDIESRPLLANAVAEDIAAAEKAHLKDITDAVTARDFFKRFANLIDLAALVRAALVGTFKQNTSPLDRTGIVVTGYGEDEYFPSAIVYECFGAILGKVLFRETNRRTISHDDASQIMPIAQSEMAKTFIYGISNDAMAEVEKVFASVLDAFEAAACSDGVDRATLKAKVANDFSDGVLEALIDYHTIPLRRVVGSLPIDELVTLAETLISIESLKERVTRPTESVSGPIDVAVISKGDEFIWIRRKHYFDPKLNLRYQAEVERGR
jgi:hypothetical protein